MIVVMSLSFLLAPPSPVRAVEMNVFQRMLPSMTQPHYFNSPQGAAVDPAGNVYVADSANNRIQKFTSDGVFVSRWGNTGQEDRKLSNPRGVAVDASGDVYVADTCNNCIKKFAADGTFLFQWGEQGKENGQFLNPAGIAVDSWGQVYVADTLNHRIQKFTAGGGFVDKWGEYGTAAGEFSSPNGIAVDRYGFVYVADTCNHRIQKFSGNGDTDGILRGDFISPYGVSIDGGENVYVCDEGTDRIHKFAPNGILITSWGGRGVANGSFNDPHGIAVSSGGTVYAVDTANDRIQTFTAEGRFLAKWGLCGNNPGKFFKPKDIAVDSQGLIYVLDTDNYRIQKFNKDGGFEKQWGSKGSDPGQFYDPSGIAADGMGNVYVADTLNDRVQKFSSDGTYVDQLSGTTLYLPLGVTVDAEGSVYVLDSGHGCVKIFNSEGIFVSEFGGPGEANGQFGTPRGIAVDEGGYVYVADTHNNRVQKFTGEGVFVAKWGVLGKNPGEFTLPSGIEVNPDGYIYVSDTENDRIQKFKSNGEFIAEFGGFGSDPGVFVSPWGLHVDADGIVYVADTDNHRIQIFKPVTTLPNHKAIILAGGGMRDNLWDAIQMNTVFAYRALTYQGYTKETIAYLSPNLQLDLDNNGEPDDVDGAATLTNLEYAITQWATDAESLVVYLVDHGDEDTFRMNGEEILSAGSLGMWLDLLQDAMSGRVIVIYDACRSGSFLADLVPAPAKERLVVASADTDENAYFITQGAISFSSYFWTQVFNGSDIREAFEVAEAALGYVTDFQHPLIDVNGNGIENEPEDYTLAQGLFMGNGTEIQGDTPVVTGLFAPVTLASGSSTTDIYADSVTDNDGIARVWAVIIPPDFTPEDPGNPVLGLPTKDLMPVGGDRYETAYDGFDMEGIYYVAIYAKDRKGNTCVPVLSTVTVQNPLARRAVIVAGGAQTDPLWPAIKKNAELACQVLRSQLYTDNRIYVLSTDNTMDAWKGYATRTNLQTALTIWATTDTRDLVVYLVGNGSREGFEINGTETLTANTLSAWLDLLQNVIPGKVIVIYDASYSGSFIPALKPPEGKERIVLSSTSHGEPAQFLVDGAVSFSSYFWRQAANAATVRRAFLQAKDAISHAGAGQTALIDDNGNGIGNEQYDGVLADKTIIGAGIILAGDAPVIGAVFPPLTINSTQTVSLWAENVTTTGTIDKVWAVVTPPGYPTAPVSELELDKTGEGKYEGTFAGFLTYGTYIATFYARDLEGNLSKPATTSIKQEIGPDVYESDNIAADARVLDLNSPRPQAHDFHTPWDLDWTRFYGLAGQTYTLQAGNPGSQCDPVIQVYKSDGTTLLASMNVSGMGQPEILEWPCPADGIYLIRINHTNHLVSGAYTGYDLSLTQPLGTPLFGTISGRVLTDETAPQPISGACIHTSGGATALAGADGTYILIDKPGTYNMTVEAPGYATQSDPDIEVTYGGSTIKDFRLTDYSGPVPDIRANGSNGPVAVPADTSVSVTVSLDPGACANVNADWWIAASTPFPAPGDWYTYVNPTGWQPGVYLCLQTPLLNLSGFEVLNMVLPAGSYVFYFAVDPPDGLATAELLDYVVVEVE